MENKLKDFYLTDSMNKAEKLTATKEFLKDYIKEVDNSDINYIRYTCAETSEMYKIILELLKEDK